MTRFHYQEFMDEDPDTYNAFVSLLAQLFIRYDLAELYHENRVEAHGLLEQKMSCEEIPFDKHAIVVIGYEHEMQKILEKVESVNDDNDEEMLILLVQIVRFFERIVNEHIYLELENRDFTQSEIKTIVLKFKMDEKVGWFLKILSGKDYTKARNNNWSLIKNFIETRNFYVHYAPATFNVHEIHQTKLNKEKFKSILEAVSDCYHFLSECRSIDIKNRYEQVQNLKKYIKEQDIKDRKDQYE